MRGGGGGGSLDSVAEGVEYTVFRSVVNLSLAYRPHCSYSRQDMWWRRSVWNSLELGYLAVQVSTLFLLLAFFLLLLPACWASPWPQSKLLQLIREREKYAWCESKRCAANLCRGCSNCKLDHLPSRCMSFFNWTSNDLRSLSARLAQPWRFPCYLISSVFPHPCFCICGWQFSNKFKTRSF